VSEGGGVPTLTSKTWMMGPQLASSTPLGHIDPSCRWIIVHSADLVCTIILSKGRLKFHTAYVAVPMLFCTIFYG